MNTSESIRKRHRHGAFKKAFQLMFESYGVVWRCKKLFFKLSMLMMVASVVVTSLAIALDPDYTLDDWLNDQSNGAYTGLKDKMGDDGLSLDGFLEKSDAQPSAESPLEEEGGAVFDVEYEPNVSVIATMIELVGYLALWFVQFIVVLFVYSQFILHQHNVSLGEVAEAVKTAPRAFYKAILYKWFYPLVYFVPALVIGAIGRVASSELMAGVAVLAMLVAFIFVMVWFLRMLFLEHLVLFRGMSIREARETSQHLMIGRKRRYVSAAICAGIILAILIGMAVGIVSLIFIMLGLGLMFVSKMLGIAVFVAFGLLIMCIYIIPQFAATGWIYMLYHEWSAELDGENAI